MPGAARGPSGALVVKIIAVVMVVVGVVGLVTSFTVFGPVSAQLSSVDAVVGNVASAIGDATQSVDAAAELVNGAAGTAVSFLDNASKSVADAEKLMKDAQKTMDDAGKQVPQLVDGTAATIETAAMALSKAGDEVASTGQQLVQLRNQLALEEIKKNSEQARTWLSNQKLYMTGDDLLAWAPWLATRMGVPAAVLEAEAMRLKSANQMMVVSLDQLRVTGDDLIALAQLTETFGGIQAAPLAAQGTAAKQQGIMWTVPAVTTLQQVEQVSNTLGDQIAQAQTALQGTGRDLKAVGSTLNANVSVLLATKPTVTTATTQAKDFLGVAGNQLAMVGGALKDVSEQAKKLQSVTDEQVTQIKKNLQDTAGSVSQISVSGIGNAVIGGLRWYMASTYILFIIAGVGLFATGMRLDAVAR